MGNVSPFLIFLSILLSLLSGTRPATKATADSNADRARVVMTAVTLAANSGACYVAGPHAHVMQTSPPHYGTWHYDFHITHDQNACHRPSKGKPPNFQGTRGCYGTKVELTWAGQSWVVWILKAMRL